MKYVVFILSVVVASACSPQSLAEQYLAEMEEIGNSGSVVIHVEEAESYGLVVGGSSNAETASAEPEDVSITPYERSGQGWTRSPMGGTSCSGPSAMMGFGDAYIYCGLITPDHPYTSVSVAGNRATILELPSGNKVWYVRSERQGDPNMSG